jgi:hypothetical protein
MGIQINGQNDTVSASDGSINISGEITANVINQTVTGVTTFTDATFTNGFNVTGVVTATQVNVGTAVTISAGVVTATSFSGDGSGLSGIDASSLKSGGVVKVQANSSGAVISGVATATQITVGDSFLKYGAVGLGTTNSTGRDAGIGTAIGTVIYVPDTGMQIYTGNEAGWRTVSDTEDSIQGTATGGTVSTADGTRRHVFTGPGSFIVSDAALTCEYFVVAGGGGSSNGGGGAGGVRSGSSISLAIGTHTIEVGGGGSHPEGNGSPSSITSPGPTLRVFATGGGGGNGGSGGSGGSAVGATVASPDGISPTVQGFPGGGPPSEGQQTGGGGGAGGAGDSGSDAGPWASVSGGGGGLCIQAPSNCPGSFGYPGPAAGQWFAGGGGGSRTPANDNPGDQHGRGGAGEPGSPPTGGGNKSGPFGGAGNGNFPGWSGGNPDPAESNSGSGGGGGGGNGGSGIIILSYPFS